MRLGTLKVTMSLLIVALLAPLGLSASSLSCSGTPSAESNTWDFHREAAELIDSVRRRAEQVRVEADSLEAFNHEGGRIFWQPPTFSLIEIRDKVNAMGDDLRRLQAIKSEALPWQQQAVDSILPMAVGLAMETTAAIDLLNDHQNTVHAVPEYSVAVNGIYSGADGVVKAVRRSPEFAQLRKELEKPPMSAAGM